MQREAQPEAAPVDPGYRDIVEAARAGVRGPGGALPHRERIQRSFGSHDISSVVAHGDRDAAAAARSIGATAFTMGDHVALGDGASLHTAAHEAAHVVQQRSGSLGLTGGVGQAGDVHERHADEVAARVVGGMSSEDLLDQYGPARTAVGDVQRQCACSGDPQPCPACREDRDRAWASPVQRQPSSGRPEVENGPRPEMSRPPDRPAKPGGNLSHKSLSEADKKAILEAFKEASAPARVVAFADGPRFVLHDTGAQATGKGKTAADKAKDLEAKEVRHIGELTAVGGTPVGEGPAAYVTAAGTPLRAHSSFFLKDRPTATEYERGNDQMTKKERETRMQAVWALTDPKVQAAAIATYLARFPALSKNQVKDETAKAEKNLDPTRSVPNSNPGNPAVLTTAGGAVGIVCEMVAAAKSAKNIAVAGKEGELEKECMTLGGLLDTRQRRIAGSTNVEISAETGSDCSVGKATKPFPGYPSAAFDGVAKLYLLAALEAGQFPEITTHYFLDTKPVTASQNRCDPRCFDLGKLYATIAKLLGHAADATYGVEFKPGTKWGASTIWWHEPVCGAKPGAATPVPKAVPDPVPTPVPDRSPPKPPATPDAGLPVS
ncbi:MAG TPA: DUF4157 domain-containing protein [Kofleriaceae bacterium]|nr:DUF4157 domain-containing protein [Kofleriaceae bacterium]